MLVCAPRTHPQCWAGADQLKHPVIDLRSTAHRNPSGQKAYAENEATSMHPACTLHREAHTAFINTHPPGVSP